MATTQQRIAPPAHYRALFGAALADLPGAATLPCRRRREESFARFEAEGFPGPKAEAWKYTQLAPLAKLEFRLPERVEVDRADLAPFLIDDPAAIRLVFVNGRLRGGPVGLVVCRKGRDDHEPGSGARGAAIATASTCCPRMTTRGASAR